MNDYFNGDFRITAIERAVFVGKNEYPQERVVFKSQLTHNELIYNLAGRNTVYFNGKVMNVEENTIRFLPKGENRQYIVENKKDDAGAECIDIFFDTDLPVADEAFVVKCNNAERIGNLFKKLFAAWVSKDDGYYFECISLLYKIFAEMQKTNYIGQSQYDLIKPAIIYIEKNFLNEKISVPFLSERCRISESYLKKLFIKKFGVTPMKYIIQMKINYACDLLSSERYTISEVAQMCRYDNVYYFSRQFKEYIGISPSVFIQRYKSSK